MARLKRNNTAFLPFCNPTISDEVRALISYEIRLLCELTLFIIRDRWKLRKTVELQVFSLPEDAGFTV